MDTVAVAGRMLVSLAVVLGFMWLIARRMKKPGRAGNANLVDVLGRRQLSRTASVAVVRVLDQALIVGITDGHVSLIGQTDLAAAELAADASPARRPQPARQPARQQPAARPRPARPAPAAPKPAGPPQPHRLRAGGTRPANRAMGSKRSAPTKQIGPDGRIVDAAPGRNTALAGSALSVDTWRQTVNSLRSLTSRRR